jgi:hypothetical protein
MRNAVSVDQDPIRRAELRAERKARFLAIGRKSEFRAGGFRISQQSWAQFGHKKARALPGLS